MPRIMDSSINKFLNQLIQGGIIFLVVFTPLAFGSVHVWAYSIMELTVIILVGLWAVKSTLERHKSTKPSKNRIVNLLIGGFVGLVLFQLIPLSPATLNKLSPATYDLYRSMLPEYEASRTPYTSDKQLAPADNRRSISIYPYASKLELLKLLSYIGMFYLTARHILSRRQINRLITIIILVGCFEALYGLLEYLSGHQYIFLFKKRYILDCSSGTFINRNHFAGYLELAASLGVGAMIYQWLKQPAGQLKGLRGFITRLTGASGSKLGLSAVALIIMLLGIISSQSRMGILSVAASLSFMSVLLVFQGGSRRFYKFILGVVVVVTLLGGWVVAEPLSDRFYYLEQEISADGSRMDIWRDTLLLLKDFPRWGSGLGTYSYIFPKYKRIEKQAAYQHAHNDYLESAVETGFSGLLILLGLAGYFLLCLITGRQRRREPYVKGIVLGGIGGVAALLFHSIADFNLHIPANALLLSIIMGISWSMVT